MITTPLLTCEAPSVPHANVRRLLPTDQPGRIAAFVFELDTLFDAPRWERARARAAARRIAALRGLDPLWSEVLALEMIGAQGRAQGAVPDSPTSAAEVLATLSLLSAESGLEWASFRDSLHALDERPQARATLELLSRRFKLAVLSSRPEAEALRLLRALDLEYLFDAVACDPEAPPAGADSASPAASPTGSPLPAISGDAVIRAARQLDEAPHACVLVAPPECRSLETARRHGMQTVALAGTRRQALAAMRAADLAVTDMGMVAALGTGADARYRCSEPSRRSG